MVTPSAPKAECSRGAEFQSAASGNDQPVVAAARTRLLLRPAEAAEALAISPRKLWELTDRREIPSVRIGRSVRYDPGDLRRWINEQKPGLLHT